MTDVVILGAGQAGIEAACSLREAGFPGGITVLGDERGTPYQRPPLSKDLSAAGELPLLPLRSRAVLLELGITLLDGATATRIDRAAQRVHFEMPDGAGDSRGYGHLVLATGGRARGAGPYGEALPGEEALGVFRLRTREDAEGLARRLRGARSAVVVGGGVIGLEFASVAAAEGVQTTVLERGDRPLRRFVGETTAAWLRERHRERGVDVVDGASVSGFDVAADGSVEAVRLRSGERLAADLVLIGTGVVPATELAEDAGLACDGGILVNGQLRTSDPTISAIGDCAAFPCAFASGSVRLESVQNATDQARYLARLLAAGLDGGPDEGAPTAPSPYAEVPWFWSVQAGTKIQVAGLADGADREVVIGDPAGGRFSVLRFAGERLACVESVSRPADHLAARRLMAAGTGPTLAEASEGRIDSLKSWSAVVPV